MTQQNTKTPCSTSSEFVELRNTTAKFEFPKVCPLPPTCHSRSFRATCSSETGFPNIIALLYDPFSLCGKFGKSVQMWLDKSRKLRCTGFSSGTSNAGDVWNKKRTISNTLQKMILHHQVIIMQIEIDMTCQQWDAKLWTHVLSCFCLFTN